MIPTSDEFDGVGVNTPTANGPGELIPDGESLSGLGLGLLFDKL